MLMFLLKDHKRRRSCIWLLFPTASLICLLLFVGGSFIQIQKEKLLRWKRDDLENKTCQKTCRPPGSESLPQGIVAKTSNLETRPLWGSPKKLELARSLFSAAVGIKQKEKVDLLVKKFLSCNFTVMLFHYDGIVDGWKDYEWSNRVIHISALNQTKWWFAKRFLHPDIVAEYSYIFLWDEDLGVENFNPEKRKVLKFHNQHLTLENRRCTIRLRHVEGEQMYTEGHIKLVKRVRHVMKIVRLPLALGGLK
ncbi:unnamed protein product [Cuscuta epithymum]|uniref:S-protein homolog n=1 Tax=Cuscuta epithymum TaxID=186058 RepID=A0AAV0EJ22_9ASTE|nr:unnamed protein product [Cuscuta epithymum]